MLKLLWNSQCGYTPNHACPDRLFDGVPASVGPLEKELLMLYFLIISKGMGCAWLRGTSPQQSVHFRMLSHSDLGQGEKEVRSAHRSHTAVLKLVTSADRHWMTFYFKSDLSFAG